MLDNASSEVELLQASLKGNTTAFEAIVKRYQSFICAITFSATADLEQSEELAHTAFIKAWANLAQLKDLTKFRAWFFTITRNIIRDYFKRKQRDIVGQARTLDKMGDVPSDRFKPVETIIDKEQQAVIRQALEQIPEKYREPLVLFYRQERSINQVAEQLELSVEAAKSRLSRGRKMLKEQVAAMVETTISRTGPSKAFTTAVIASVAGLAIKGSGVAAAGVAAAAVKTETATGVATIMSGVTAKIITAAAVVAIGVGGVVTYKQITKAKPEPEFSQAGLVAQEQGEEQDKITEEITEQEQNKEMDAVFVKAIGEIEETKTGVESEKTIAKTSGKPIEVEKKEFVFKPKGVLSGIVTDSKTDEPIEGAIIVAKGTEYKKAVTDINGMYYFAGLKEAGLLKPGNVKISVSAQEYVDLGRPFEEPIVALREETKTVKHFTLNMACIVDMQVVDSNGDQRQLFLPSATNKVSGY